MSRLAVLGEDGTVRVVGAGGAGGASAARGARGSGNILLGDDRHGEVQNLPPAWSGDGRRVVWTSVAGPLDGHLEVADVETRERREMAAGFVSFYLSPSPDGRRVAHLSEGPLGLELGVVDLDSTVDVLLARGVPLYWAWSPDSTRLLVHAGDRLEVVELDGTHRELGLDPGTFLSPAWTDDGEHVVVAVAAGGGLHRIVVADVGGTVVDQVVDLSEAARFALAPRGRRLAYLVPGPQAVVVADLATLGSERAVVLDRGAVGCWWSPGGDRLAVLAVESDDDRAWLRWHVWDGGSVSPLGRFLAPAAFTRGVLPFFEQFGQSHRLWSADGRAFAYPALERGGRSVIWTQPADGGRPSKLVRGAAAWWSPV